MYMSEPSDEPFELHQKLEVRGESYAPFRLVQDGIIEMHHLLGSANSGDVVPVDKALHDFLTSRINALSPRDRQNLLALALENLAAWFEVGVVYLRLIAEKIRVNDVEVKK
jgi:hypothetical protein